MVCTGGAPVGLVAAAALTSKGRAVGFCLSGSLGVFNADVLSSASAAVFIVSTILYVAADGLHLRFVRHRLDTPILLVGAEQCA